MGIFMVMINQNLSNNSDINSILFYAQKEEGRDASKIEYVQKLAGRFEAEIEIYRDEGQNSRAYETLVAESEKADLLVTGTPTIGHAEYSEVFSSAMQLAKDAACPVMLIPDHLRCTPLLSMNRPVVICSVGEDLVQIMDDILPFLKESWVSIMVSHYQAYKGGANDVRKKHDLADFLQLNDISCQLVNADESSAQDLDAMVSEINNGQYDFVVLRAYGRSNMRELFLGLLPRAIMSQARVPVLLTG